MAKKKLLMYVYNDITTDARVQRAAEALCHDFQLTLVSTQKGKQVEDVNYKNILVGGKYKGALGIFATIKSAFHIIRRVVDLDSRSSAFDAGMIDFVCQSVF